MLNETVLVESVVTTASEAEAAQRCGAGRVELCAAIECGGLTPSPGLLSAVLSSTTLPVAAMARPRPGGFVHDRCDADALLEDIAYLARDGADAIVCGMVTAQRRVDTELLARAIDASSGVAIVFHRIFDDCVDLDEALDGLIAAGVTRLLTSGGGRFALEGASRLRGLSERAAGRIEILAGGGVRAANAAEIVRLSGARQLHAGPRRSADGDMFSAPTELDPDALIALVKAVS